VTRIKKIKKIKKKTKIDTWCWL